MRAMAGRRWIKHRLLDSGLMNAWCCRWAVALSRRGLRASTRIDEFTDRYFQQVNPHDFQERATVPRSLPCTPCGTKIDPQDNRQETYRLLITDFLAFAYRVFILTVYGSWIRHRYCYQPISEPGIPFSFLYAHSFCRLFIQIEKPQLQCKLSRPFQPAAHK